MNTYIFAYTARMSPNGVIKGRVEATNGWDAEQRVLRSNGLYDSVSVKLLKNQTAARKQKYEVLP